MSSKQINMHRLIRITLVNWYLFGAEDLHIDGDSVIFRGVNGTGKSSILDAMQTVFAGGDEQRMSLNAASSKKGPANGKGRSIRSYVLGEVAQSPGHSASESRQISNSYICLTFVDKQGQHYAFGLGFYANKALQKVDKHPFLMKGYGISKADFLASEHVVLPWKDVEKRLKQAPGQLMLPPTANEFRTKYAELMSAAGADHAISEKVMFRALKNGITFKEQNNISEFTRNYILPEHDIDVVRIENEYREYSGIVQTIEEARDRLSALHRIIDHLQKYCSRKELATAYHWAACEARHIAADYQLAETSDRLQDKIEEIERLTESQADDDTKANALSVERDNIRDTLQSSDIHRATQVMEQKKQRITKQLQADVADVANARKLLLDIEKLKVDNSASDSVISSLSGFISALKQTTRLHTTDMIQQWPVNKKDVQKTQAVLQTSEPVLIAINEEKESFAHEYRAIKTEVDELTQAAQQMSRGKSSLRRETQEIIQLLADNDIACKAVCDLADITDPDWQQGIEHFLGSNREALVVLDDGRDGGIDKVNDALRIYRDYKKTHPTVRSVKIIKPNEFKTIRPTAAGTAAALIEAQDPVAKGYLMALLHNLKLVQTEEQLRREKRAITRDGMVSANGTVGGGNRIQWLLIGTEARQRQGVEIEAQLRKLLPQCRALEQTKNNLETLYRNFQSHTEQAIKACKQVLLVHDRIAQNAAEQKKIDGEIRALHNNMDSTLHEQLAKVEDAIAEHKKARLLEQEKIGRLRESIKHDETSVLSLEQQLKDFAEQRIAATAIEGFSQSKANELLDKLTEELGDDEFEKIAKMAESRSKKNDESANHAFVESAKNTADYCSRYEPEDRSELIKMVPQAALIRCQAHVDRITNTEIVLYEGDAKESQEKMLHSFRSEVIGKLQECFSRVDDTFQTLNNTLKNLPFNNTQYRFTYKVVESEILAKVHAFITQSNTPTPDGLFDDEKDDPVLALITDTLKSGKLEELSDYRNFYSFDIVAKDLESGTDRRFSELLRVGSGGEQQSPFYIALGASFMSAYKVRVSPKAVHGGGAIAMFDEAFSNMDGNNTKAALTFFRDIGLQVILAAPLEVGSKVAPMWTNPLILFAKAGIFMWTTNNTRQKVAHCWNQTIRIFTRN